MQVIVVSPESEYANEADVIVRLLQGGLDRYHLRKPSWSAVDCATLLCAVPAEWHASISIHQHHMLAKLFAVGLHFKDDATARGIVSESSRDNNDSDSSQRSRSLHSLDDLEGELRDVDYAFLSPVFQSISKRGYVPRWSEVELRAALLQDLPAKLYALGGITADTLGQSRDYGFEGVVLHGALWQSNDPLAAFATIRKEVA